MTSTNKTVLIVDDVKEMRELLAAHVENLDVETAQAGSESSMLSYLKSDMRKPDLILLDINLAETSGIASVAKIRALPDGDRLRLCFISGERDRNMVLAAMKVGAIDYIVKPIDPIILRKKLSQMLGLSSDSAQLAKVKVNMVATFPQVPMKTDAKVLELSEEGVRIQSNLEFEKGSLLQLEATDLNAIFGKPTPFDLKILSVSKSSNGFHFECAFVGLHESMATKIRKFVISLPKQQNQN